MAEVERASSADESDESKLDIPNLVMESCFLPKRF